MAFGQQNNTQTELKYFRAATGFNIKISHIKYLGICKYHYFNFFFIIISILYS